MLEILRKKAKWVYIGGACVIAGLLLLTRPTVSPSNKGATDRTPGSPLSIAQACEILELDGWSFKDDEVFPTIQVRLVTYEKRSGQFNLSANFPLGPTEANVSSIELAVFGPFPREDKDVKECFAAFDNIRTTAEKVLPSCKLAISRARATRVEITMQDIRAGGGPTGSCESPRRQGTATSPTGWRVHYVFFTGGLKDSDRNCWFKLLFQRIEP